MMLQELKKKNPKLPLFGIDSEDFAEYGCRITGINVDDMIKSGKEMIFPAEGSIYEPSVSVFETLPAAEEIRKRCFGELPMQVGYCCGHNRLLNAWEWHASIEINIAVTDMVLILAKRSQFKAGRIDSSCAKAFFLRAGDMVEIYATSLHFCPCEVDEKGFGCVVALPFGTNIPLDEPAADKLLFRKNKWLIAHVDNNSLIRKGVIPGIYGANFEVQ